jgi:hypothetical protein
MCFTALALPSCLPGYGVCATSAFALRVALRCTSNADLRQLLAQLGLPPLARQDAYRRPLARHVQLAGERAFLTIDRVPELRLNLSMADSENPYDVTSSAVAAAIAVEALLLAHEARIIDPPVASIYCVCPTYYPDLWTNPTK